MIRISGSASFNQVAMARSGVDDSLAALRNVPGLASCRTFVCRSQPSHST